VHIPARVVETSCARLDGGEQLVEQATLAVLASALYC